MRPTSMANLLRCGFLSLAIWAAGACSALTFRYVDLGPGVALSINDLGEVTVLDGSFITSRVVRENLSSFALTNPQGIPVDSDETGGFAVARFDGLPGYYSSSSGPFDLSTFGGGLASVNRITKGGFVLGMATNPTGLRIAFWWKLGVGRFPIPPMIPTDDSEAFDLNSENVVVGSVNNLPAVGTPSGWAGTLDSTNRTGRAERVNDEGRVIGTLNTITPTGTSRRDLVWWNSPTSAPITLEENAIPISLNNSDWLVGARCGSNSPFLRTPNLGVFNIQSRTPDLPAGVIIVTLADLNDRNQVVGTVLTPTGSYRAVRFDPIEETTEIRGEIRFSGVTPPSGTQVWIQLRNVATAETTEYGPISVGAGEGSYSFRTPLIGTYRVAFRSPRYLTQLSTTTVTLPAPPYFGVVGTLIPGDIDENNEIGASDFSVLASTYDLVEGDPGFDARADVNYDGEVGASDFSLLAASYDRVGD